MDDPGLRPTGRTALVIVPPADVCGFADGYRRRFMADLMYVIPPHIPVTDNFVPYNELEGALPRLQLLLGTKRPFALALRGFDTFRAESALVIYLAHPERVTALYRAVLGEFPDAKAYGGKYGDAPRPCMTVGLFAAEDELEKAYREVAGQHLYIAWDVESVGIYYQVEDGGWELYADVPLGGAVAEPDDEQDPTEEGGS